MVQKTLKQLPIKHKALLSGLALFLLVLIFIPSEQAQASKNSQILEVGKRYDIPVSIDSPEQLQQALEVDTPDWQVFKIKQGDNLAKILHRAGLTPQETHYVSTAGKDAKQLLKMRPGQQLELLIDPAGQLESIRYQLSSTKTLEIDRQDTNKFASKILEQNLDTRFNFAQGEIVSNFWNAAVKANLPENQIMNLAGIFGWDIDFALELRQGDSFNVVYEEHFSNGEFVESGKIVAAEFVNQGEVFTAILHEDGNYYTPQGRSMRKSFLRAPVNFKYISSSFKKKRFHPVQKRWKAHRGVDYAANTGTPVIAAGDGRVIRATYDKFNGHHVFIQHGEKYVTKYLHFTKRAVKKGQSVKQGQVIGYVGATGLAAGPHLHYEFLVDGVHRNPRTVALPQAKPIAKDEAQAFAKIAAKRVEQLGNTKRIMLAMN
ncbi:peptidoglycan DD-metalloendopeptidase family protein [Aliiglaciecola sp. LCG003]|uniref:peptidoglycan DD-metalloendopeptidase family protein n=1 Tax=Aliiglaciecola sp. LCG003 TaxID=3053655 RepID=UPI00257361A9|nr:peptidoglycan DD-metalloendopeptidase family protein [Aliiglaciecola sp. LCG003]WJG08894.1 peptidoglycan DD-metalloendopeptidase family protein [Aliiglaciecola sp. LCG003]